MTTETSTFHEEKQKKAEIFRGMDVFREIQFMIIGSSSDRELGRTSAMAINYLLYKAQIFVDEDIFGDQLTIAFVDNRLALRRNKDLPQVTAGEIQVLTNLATIKSSENNVLVVADGKGLTDQQLTALSEMLDRANSTVSDVLVKQKSPKVVILRKANTREREVMGADEAKPLSPTCVDVITEDDFFYNGIVNLFIEEAVPHELVHLYLEHHEGVDKARKDFMDSPGQKLSVLSLAYLNRKRRPDLFRMSKEVFERLRDDLSESLRAFLQERGYKKEEIESLQKKAVLTDFDMLAISPVVEYLDHGRSTDEKRFNAFIKVWQRVYQEGLAQAIAANMTGKSYPDVLSRTKLFLIMHNIGIQEEPEKIIEKAVAVDGNESGYHVMSSFVTHLFQNYGIPFSTMAAIFNEMNWKNFGIEDFCNALGVDYRKAIKEWHSHLLH